MQLLMNIPLLKIEMPFKRVLLQELLIPKRLPWLRGRWYEKFKGMIMDMNEDFHRIMVILLQRKEKKGKKPIIMVLLILRL